jgi:dihydrodipicolinate synthase/N-acetylneuraminate lyase
MSTKNILSPDKMIKPYRKITGMSAILLPFNSDLTPDWKGFEAHLVRTLQAGLTPAVNMDTGYASLLDRETYLEVLQRSQSLCAGKEYVAGAFVGDAPGSQFNLDAYREQFNMIQSHGGTPVIFQSFGLTSLLEAEIVDAYKAFAKECNRFIAFELGTMFAPFGRIYSLETYAGLMQIPNCIGAKHSSLRRELEWERILLRDKVRPDFKVFTGNDLAIDMVMYGSDYLLGISTFAPDMFALRDKFWLEGNPAFYELNDLLQYLGQFTFRSPVPAYKHNAAQFLKLQGWIACNETHPQAPQRPESDIPVLETILQRLNKWRENS